MTFLCGMRNKKKYWDADERRFSGSYEAKNGFPRLSAQTCVSFNKKVSLNFFK